MMPATAINAASARPSFFLRANSDACFGQRRIASPRAASFEAPAKPTVRFHDAGDRDL